MYNPAAFREDNPETVRALMETYPLATLITVGADGPEASHLPLLYRPSETGPGILCGHLAKANSQWRDATRPEGLVIFSGPDHYVSPAWYPSKQENGKVVPTWNYVTVHAYGTVRFVEDPRWLLENVRALSDVHERSMGTGWKVDDAPADYIESLLRAIVGVEFTITKLEGKIKASQNRPAADREAVAARLEKLATPSAQAMAEFTKT